LRGAWATFVLHHAIGGDPGDLGLPGQLDDRGRVGHGQHVRMRGRHVEPGGETREACAVLLHVGDGLRRDQFRALPAEQVGEGDHEVFHAAFSAANSARSVVMSRIPRFVLVSTLPAITPVLHQYPGLPGYQSVPASGTCAIAAASIVRAQRSSGSRLCRWLWPQARAMVCASSVMTLR
jgi:hypothetical protein